MFKRSGSAEPAESDHTSDVEEHRPSWNRGRVTFWVLTVGCAGVGAAVVSPWRSPWLGLVVGALVGAVLGTMASVVMFVWPVLRTVWHWLFELVTVGAAVATVTAFAALMGSWWWSTAFVVPAGAVTAVRPLRRRVLALVWCAIVRHRLRVCFAAFIRARNKLDPGLAPLILPARPTPSGERVWVWLRTGLDVAELERRTGKIAVACWASEVQVCASRRFAALVRFDIARRDPLRLVIASPLAGVPGERAERAAGDVDVSGLALDLDGVSEESITMAGGRR